MAGKKTAALPFVKSVTSNLKSPNPDGAPWTVELGQKTLVVGDNTSQRTALSVTGARPRSRHTLLTSTCAT